MDLVNTLFVSLPYQLRQLTELIRIRE